MYFGTYKSSSVSKEDIQGTRKETKDGPPQSTLFPSFSVEHKVKFREG